MKLWLVRHALPLAAEGLCYGASDVAADPRASLQAAGMLARVLPRALGVRCSPLRRCRQLADALRVLRPDLGGRVDARLAEMDFGQWEGRRWVDIAQHEFAAWTADFTGYRCGGGESVGRLLARVEEALADARRADTDALWITHGGVIRAVRLRAGGVAPPVRADQWPREGLDFGQVECIDLATSLPP